MNFRQGGAPTLSAQLWAWYSELKQVLDFWNPDCRPWITDDPHLWTISLEMGNSVLLFAVLIAVARCKAMLRMGILGGMILVCMRAGQWVGSAFLMGMFLAELGLIQDSLKHSFDHPEIIALGIPGEESESLLGEGGVELREEVAERAQRRHQIRHRRLREARRVGNIAMKCICIFNLIPALWLAGWPEMYPEQNAGFAWIMARTGPPYDDIFRQQFPWFGLVALIDHCLLVSAGAIPIVVPHDRSCEVSGKDQLFYVSHALVGARVLGPKTVSDGLESGSWYLGR